MIFKLRLIRCTNEILPLANRFFLLNNYCYRVLNTDLHLINICSIKGHLCFSREFVALTKIGERAALKYYFFGRSSKHLIIRRFSSAAFVASLNRSPRLMILNASIASNVFFKPLQPFESFAWINNAFVNCVVGYYVVVFPLYVDVYDRLMQTSHLKLVPLHDSLKG